MGKSDTQVTLEQNLSFQIIMVQAQMVITRNFVEGILAVKFVKMSDT